MPRTPRKKNVVETERINISTTIEVVRALRSFVETGYFGKTPTDLAKMFVEERVRQHVEQGWLERKPKRGGR